MRLSNRVNKAGNSAADLWLIGPLAGIPQPSLPGQCVTRHALAQTDPTSSQTDALEKQKMHVPTQALSGETKHDVQRQD